MSVLSEVLSQLPGDVAPYVGRLAEQEPAAVDQLRSELRAYSRELAELARTDPQVDAELGLELAGACRTLLERLESPIDPVVHRVVHACIRYFLLDDDADPDTASWLGLDDDVEVFNVVVVALGHSDLRVALD